MQIKTILNKAATWLRGTPKPAHQRSFQAARMDRLTANWMATEASLNHELRSDLNKLRSRGRELLQNNDYAVKFAGMCKNNIIGPGGVRLQVRTEDRPGIQDRLANTAIETAWKDWSQACDITGRQSLRDICDTLVGGLPSDGEFLVRIVRGTEAANKYGIALQIIDVDRIDTTLNVGKTATTNAIILGVEVDDYRRPVALPSTPPTPMTAFKATASACAYQPPKPCTASKLSAPNKCAACPGWPQACLACTTWATSNCLPC